MSEQNLVARPITCDSKTNLYPFFESCLKEVTDSKKKKFASVTFETNYSDPLAILEKIHSPLDLSATTKSLWMSFPLLVEKLSHLKNLMEATGFLRLKHGQKIYSLKL